MKLALIPPLCFKMNMLKTDYQLVLPALMDSDVEYETLIYQLKERGDFIILDNGAAEKQLWDEPDLIEMASEMQADELAIPDILGDSEETVRRLMGFFNIHEEALAAHSFGTDEGPGLGFVAQGKNMAEAMSTVRTVMSTKWAPYLSTVYLPRLLVRESGNVRIRLSIAAQVYMEYGDRLNIHMFGAAPEWPREALAVATECSYVRGMDTSMPYNWAHARRVMGGASSIWDSNSIDSYLVKRPTDYFELEPEDFDLEILRQNVKVLETWIGNTL